MSYNCKLFALQYPAQTIMDAAWQLHPPKPNPCCKVRKEQQVT